MAQLGAFWSTLGADKWPHVDDTMQLPVLKERFGDEIEWNIPQLQLMISDGQSHRLLLRNASKTRMVQIQNSRLVLNWTGDSGGGYPRYEVLRAEFSALLDQLASFLEHIKLPAPKFDQWEVTYLNQVPRLGLWSKASDATFFEPLHSLPSQIQGCELEDVSTAIAFVIPEKRGRLHVSMRRGMRQPGQEVLKLCGPTPGHSETIQSSPEVFVFDFTARGPLPDGEETPKDRLLQGLDLGRETIVRSFRDMMSVEANQYWGSHDGCTV